MVVPADLAALRTADADAAARFFAEVDPEELVRAVSETSDADLLELIGRDQVRPAAVEGILARLHEFSLPDRVARLRGVVRFDLDRRGTVLERHALSFADGEMTLVPDATADLPADVVLRTSLLRFVRLVSGEYNSGWSTSPVASTSTATPTWLSVWAGSSRCRAPARSRSTRASWTRSRSRPCWGASRART